MSLNKTSEAWDRAIFYPKAIILVEAHMIKLHAKYQMPGPSKFRKEDFYSIAYSSVCKKLTFPKKRSAIHGHRFFSVLIGPLSLILHTKPHGLSPFGSGEEDF